MGDLAPVGTVGALELWASELRTYLTFVGAVFIVAAAYLFVRRLSAQLTGRAAVGRVLGHEQRADDEDTSYFPIVEFTDSRGRVHRFTSVAGGSSASPAVGTTVRVRYLPEDPKVAYIQSFLHMWAAPLALAALGAGALVARWQH